MQALTRSSAPTVLIAAASLLIAVIVIAAMLLARHNVRARRADLRGAWRLAVFVITGYSAFRRTAPATAAWVVILALFQASQVLSSGTSLWIAAAFQACLIVALTIMVVRYGLLVTAVTFAVGNIVEDIPLTLSLSHWTATTSNLALATVFAVTCFGFYASRAGQPLFGKFDV